MGRTMFCVIFLLQFWFCLEWGGFGPFYRYFGGSGMGVFVVSFCSIRDSARQILTECRFFKYCF